MVWVGRDFRDLVHPWELCPNVPGALAPLGKEAFPKIQPFPEEGNPTAPGTEELQSWVSCMVRTFSAGLVTPSKH